MIFIKLGLAGSYSGIIIVHLIPTIPYMIRMLTAVYQGLGRDFEDQAMILGASRWQVLSLVTLPMLLPTLLFSKISAGTLDASAAGIALLVTIPGIVLLLITERYIKEEAFGKGFGN